ncbi:MAG TPA: VOC family protein [Verrucomicrobiae bacterium]|nr:VOC family protein [Verrucomicrobiae bacterium]
MHPKVNRINVVFLYTQDLPKLRHFYEQAFDLGKPVIDAKWWVEYEVGDGSHLALHQTDALRFEGADRKSNTVKFSVDVTDIGHYVEKLTGLGATFLYGPRQEYGFSLAEFEDPEGYRVRLYEKVKKT